MRQYTRWWTNRNYVTRKCRICIFLPTEAVLTDRSVPIIPSHSFFTPMVAREEGKEEGGLWASYRLPFYDIGFPPSFFSFLRSLLPQVKKRMKRLYPENIPFPPFIPLPPSTAALQQKKTQYGPSVKLKATYKIVGHICESTQKGHGGVGMKDGGGPRVSARKENRPARAQSSNYRGDSRRSKQAARIVYIITSLTMPLLQCEPPWATGKHRKSENFVL